MVETLGLLLTQFLLLGVHAAAAVPQRSGRVLNYTKTQSEQAIGCDAGGTILCICRVLSSAYHHLLMETYG